MLTFEMCVSFEIEKETRARERDLVQWSELAGGSVWEWDVRKGKLPFSKNKRKSEMDFPFKKKKKLTQLHPRC
jgi:hypothetical protein